MCKACLNSASDLSIRFETARNHGYEQLDEKWEEKPRAVTRIPLPQSMLVVFSNGLKKKIVIV